MTDSLDGTALIIGIDAYSGGVKPLQSAVTDAAAIAAVLRDQHGYEVSLLLDEQAQGAAILHALESELPGRLDEATSFLLYFAGHGVARGDGSEGPQGFLLPADAALGDQESWLSMDRLRAALERLPCKHLLVILDCCFAGSFRWASTRDLLLDDQPLFDSQYERYLQGTAWQALTSASHDQLAMDVSPGYANTRDESDAGSHSPFARALIEGLAGQADSSRGGHEPDGVITATELFQFAFEEFGTADTPTRQTPGIWPLRPDNTGEYIFRNPRQPRKTRPDPPLDRANNPWVGLNAYTSDQAPLFFGRERCVEDILDRILASHRGGLVAVVGASGTGKSSVVRAGVLPRLENPPRERAERLDGWSVFCLPRLDDDPERLLDDARKHLDEAPDPARSLLFIDQFEELYTQCRDRERRAAFLGALRGVIDGPTTVVLTLRSDFEPRPAQSEALSDLWAEARIVVPPFSSEEFRQCIEGPAAVRALYFEPPALVGELIDEVMTMPGPLPMLSFALEELYHQAQLRRRASGSADRSLTRADYEATGGVVGAVHRRADSLYDRSEPDTQATIRRVFLRMVSQDGARITRRRIDRDELLFEGSAEQARVDRVLEDYAEARLLVLDGDEIQPAHDTLIVAWETLQDWLGEAGPLALQRTLWYAAKAWSEGDRDRGLLWHDNPLLPEAEARLEELNALERRFLRATRAHRNRRRRVRLGLAAGMTLSILTAVVYAGLKQLDERIAEEDARQARATSNQVYLHIMEEGGFFELEEVILPKASGGMLQPTESADGAWRLLVNEGACWDEEGDVSIQADCPFVIGRTFGEGRVMAIGHEALITYIDRGEPVNRRKSARAYGVGSGTPSALPGKKAASNRGESLFLDLALRWLSGDLKDPSKHAIVFTTGHEEALYDYHFEDFSAQRLRLMDQGYTVQFAEDLGKPDALARTSVLVIGNAWQSFTEAELESIQAFVANGGGLLMAGLGWSWIDNGPHDLADRPEAALDAYPMNHIAELFGARWTDSPIWTMRDLEGYGRAGE